MKNRDESFTSKIQAALYAFQMLEEGLKIVIGLSYEVIQASTPEPVKFTFNTDEIYNAPLGNLKKMYLRVSGNAELGKEIDQLIPWRNHCAHRAFLEEFMSRADVKRGNKEDEAGVVAATQATLRVLQTLRSLRKVRIKNERTKINEKTCDTIPVFRLFLACAFPHVIAMKNWYGAPRLTPLQKRTVTCSSGAMHKSA